MRSKGLWKWSGILFMVFGLLLSVTLSSAVAASDKEKIVWTFSQMATGKYADSTVFNEWLPKQLTEATGGQLEFHAPFDLVPLRELFHAVRDGLAQGGLTGTPYYSGDWPLGSFHAIPGIIRADDEFQAVINNVVWPYWEKSLRKKFNIQLMAVYNWAGIRVFCKTPIRTVEDFKGQKMRGMGYYDSLAFQEIGAKGMSIPWTEAFLAVQRGVVDGLNCGIISFESLGFAEYCKYFHTWPIHGSGCSAFAIMNGDVFDSLPDELKPVVKKVFGDAGDKISRDNCALVPVYEKKLFEKGCKLIKIPEDQVEKCLEMTKLVREKWLEQCKKAGSPEAAEMLKEVEAFLAKYRAAKKAK